MSATRRLCEWDGVRIFTHLNTSLLRGEWFDPSLNVADVILFLESQKYVLESDFELGFCSKCLSESDNFTKANSQEENLI